jgi:hypothetical protein
MLQPRQSSGARLGLEYHRVTSDLNTLTDWQWNHRGIGHRALAKSNSQAQISICVAVFVLAGWRAGCYKFLENLFHV